MKNILFILSLLIPLSAFTQPDDYQCIWHTSGATDTSGLGHKLVAAGDQNMDGYDDILVANWGTGEVFLYFGGNPMDTIPDMVFTEEHIYNFGYLPLECRDLNGDTYPDFTIGSDCERANSEVYVYFGGPLLDNQADLVLEPDTNHIGSSTHFGEYTSMGDFNGDGYDDLIIGAPFYLPIDFIEGKIFIYYGGPDFDATPDFTITGDHDLSGLHNLAFYISCGGDANNDGYNDILSRGFYGSEISDGRMLFFGGSPPDSIPDWELRQYLSSSNFTLRSGSFIIPDFTGDDCDEIVLGGLGPAGMCAAFVFYGGDVIDTTYNLKLEGWGGDQGGCAYAGDVNNDGWPDVILGNDGGRIDVFFLHPGLGGIIGGDLCIAIPGTGGPNIGYAGDVNGDGVDDFMFATYSYYDYQGDVFIYSDSSLSSVEPFKTQNSKFKILSAYPTPFNLSTTITFQLDYPTQVKLSIYNLLGQRVINLMDSIQQPGVHKTQWDGRNENGENLPSGIYIIQITTNTGKEASKILLIR